MPTKLTSTDLETVMNAALGTLQAGGVSATRKRQLRKFVEAAAELRAGLSLDETMADIKEATGGNAESS